MLAMDYFKYYGTIAQSQSPVFLLCLCFCGSLFLERSTAKAQTMNFNNAMIVEEKEKEWLCVHQYNVSQFNSLRAIPKDIEEAFFRHKLCP